MLTTVEGIYKDGKVELNETPVGLEGARVLVTFLPESVLVSQPQVLYGAWKGKMPYVTAICLGRRTKYYHLHKRTLAFTLAKKVDSD